MADQKFNVLLQGPIGTGKTHSTRTLITEGCVNKLCVLATEPGIASIMGDLPPENVSWCHISPASVDWDEMIKGAERTNTLSPDQLMKMPWPNRSEYDQLVQVYQALSNFTCDRTGECLGPVDSWGPDKALVVDGLSGLSKMAVALAVGAKPILAQAEWGIAQRNLMNTVSKLVNDLKCTFVLTAHVSRRYDEVKQASILSLDSVGKAINPDLPKEFDEVIMTRREGGKFFWSTDEDYADLKTRRLPFSNKITPSFKLIFDGKE